ncbi:hypothetical protein CR513_42770, partial [Mucuna pruriens]
MPPPLERQLGLPREEWCEFHRTPGHMTEDCRILKSQIEKLIQEGYLGCFVKRNENERLKTGELPERDRSRTLGRDSDYEQNRSQATMKKYYICVMMNPKTREKQLVETIWNT